MPDIKITQNGPVLSGLSDTKLIAGGMPIRDEFIVSADQVTIIGDGTTEHPLHAAGGGSGGSSVTIPLINADGSTAVPGTPVYSSAAGHFDFARANSLATSKVIGLVSTLPIASGASGKVDLAGALTLTTVQWDAVTGQVGGLTAGSRYWLDPATAGKITTTAPVAAGQVVEPIGLAVDTTIMALNISPSPVLL